MKQETGSKTQWGSCDCDGYRHEKGDRIARSSRCFVNDGSTSVEVQRGCFAISGMRQTLRASNRAFGAFGCRLGRRRNCGEADVAGKQAIVVRALHTTQGNSLDVYA